MAGTEGSASVPVWSTPTAGSIELGSLEQATFHEVGHSGVDGGQRDPLARRQGPKVHCRVSAQLHKHPPVGDGQVRSGIGGHTLQPLAHLLPADQDTERPEDLRE